jgi:hypothetical protein
MLLQMPEMKEMYSFSDEQILEIRQSITSVMNALEKLHKKRLEKTSKLVPQPSSMLRTRIPK